jgi:hypothetical protein
MMKVNETTLDVLIHIRGTSCPQLLSKVILHTYPGCFCGIPKFKPFSDNGSSLRYQRNIKPIDQRIYTTYYISYSFYTPSTQNIEECIESVQGIGLRDEH